MPHPDLVGKPDRSKLQSAQRFKSNNFTDEIRQYIQSTGEYKPKHPCLTKFIDRQRRLQARVQSANVNRPGRDPKYLKKQFAYHQRRVIDQIHVEDQEGRPAAAEVLAPQRPQIVIDAYPSRINLDLEMPTNFSFVHE